MLLEPGETITAATSFEGYVLLFTSQGRVLKLEINRQLGLPDYKITLLLNVHH